jgi:PKHD-type hydroxylase
MIQIDNILTSDQLASVNAALNQAEFVDGKLTAGKAAERVKNNLELSRDSNMRDALLKALVAAVQASPMFHAYAMPARMATPIVSCYRPGMFYGRHVDDPVMGVVGQHYRSDVSFTLFLNEPDEYEGGELSVHTRFGEQQVKGKAGSMVVYPSSSIHEVKPVVEGKRLVMLSWLQSMIRSSGQREILFDLWQAREQLLAEQADTPVCDQVDLAYVNLVRMWANP